MVVHKHRYRSENILNMAVRIAAEGTILFCILVFILHEAGIISSPGIEEVLGAGLIALFADMRRLESIIVEVRERLVRIESGLESLIKVKKP